MKKKLMMVVATMCAAVMLMPNVHAVKNAEACKATSGSVVDYTSKDVLVGASGADSASLNPIIEYSDDCKTITVKYDANVIGSSMKIIADDGNRGGVDAAWIGIKYTPKDESSKYYIRTIGEGLANEYEQNEAKYEQPKYVPVSYETLMAAIENGGIISRTYHISYADTVTAQTEPDVIITVQIDSKQLTVQDPDEVLADEVEADENGNIWSSDIYAEEFAKFEEANKPTPTPTVKPAAKEENPDTSDNASLLFGLLALGACGLGLATKKRLSE